MLGGLITDDRTTAKSGIPGLGDVPFVGRFFSSTGENATKRVLFVFLRPTILRTRAEIGTGLEPALPAPAQHRGPAEPRRRPDRRAPPDPQAAGRDQRALLSRGALELGIRIPLKLSGGGFRRPP